MAVRDAVAFNSGGYIPSGVGTHHLLSNHFFHCFVLTVTAIVLPTLCVRPRFQKFGHISVTSNAFFFFKIA